MIAKFSPPCTCGARVNPGDKIAFSSKLRRVTMCPACAPAKGHRIGRYVPTAHGFLIASIRNKVTGAVDGIAVQHAAADSRGSAAVYIREDGEWVYRRSIGRDLMDAPSGLTHSHVELLVREAAARFRAATESAAA